MKSIRQHLTAGLLAGFALLLGVAGALIYLSERMALYRELDARLKVKALAMAALTKPGRNEVEFEYPRRIESAEGRPSPAEYYQLFAADGAPLVRAPALGAADLPRRFGSMSSPAYWNLKLPDGTAARAVGVRFVARSPAKPKKPEPLPPEAKAKDKGEPKAPPEPVEVGLVVAEDRWPLEAALNRLALILLGAGALTLLATVLLVPWVLRRGLTPLRQLADHAQRLDAGTLGNRFPSQPLPQELEPIVHRLNDLLARLETSFERERRFSADLAHELRTPIAGLRATAEVALQWPDQNGPESWEAVRELAAQMESLSERLLALARADHRALPVRRETVALPSLVDSVWRPLHALAATKQIGLRTDLPASATLETDAVLLRGILVNLLGNAVEYSPPGSIVQVRFAAANGDFELVVSNPADHLEAADLPKLFDRFWRKDPARTGSEHLGLGLALAKSYAALLGCELGASWSAPRQLDLRLSGRSVGGESTGTPATGRPAQSGTSRTG